MKREHRNGEGGQLGNQNAQKTLGILPGEYNLSNVEDCFKLLDRIVVATCNGEIGARSAGAANNAIRIILSYHSDIAKVAENTRLIEESKRRIKELEEKLDAQQAPHEFSHDVRKSSHELSENLGESEGESQ